MQAPLVYVFMNAGFHVPLSLLLLLKLAAQAQVEKKLFQIAFTTPQAHVRHKTGRNITQRSNQMLTASLNPFNVPVLNTV